MTRLNKLGKFIVLILSIILIYLIISIYFTNHYFFNTVINGIDLSLKAYDDSEDVIKNNLKGYGLTLIERDGTTDRIDGQDIGWNTIMKMAYLRYINHRKPYFGLDPCLSSNAITFQIYFAMIHCRWMMQ